MRFRNRLTRRTVLAAGAMLVASALLPEHASAQTAWPNRPIKLIVPFAPGASIDTIGRVVASKLAARLGQPMVVDNKTGAGGSIGAAYVAKEPPNGYTLLFNANPLVTAALVGPSGRKPPYDPLKDLQPIGQVGAAPYLVVVSNSLKATTLREFIDLARAKPQSINYGSAGVGSMNHLGVELFASVANIKLMHIPYQGLGPAITGLLGGNLEMMMPSLPAAMPHLRSGKMRALAVTSAQRSPFMPELPTVSEAGLPGFRGEAWWGLLGPAGLPAPVVKRLNEELNAVLATPDMRELLARDGTDPRPGTPEDFGELIRSEVTLWTRLINEARIEAN